MHCLLCYQAGCLGWAQCMSSGNYRAPPLIKALIWILVSSTLQTAADSGHVLVPCRGPSVVCHVQDILREARGCSFFGLDRTVWIFLLGHGGGVALMLITDTDLRSKVSGISAPPSPCFRVLQSLQVPLTKSGINIVLAERFLHPLYQLSSN